MRDSSDPVLAAEGLTANFVNRNNIKNVHFSSTILGIIANNIFGNCIHQKSSGEFSWSSVEDFFVHLPLVGGKNGRSKVGETNILISRNHLLKFVD